MIEVFEGEEIELVVSLSGPYPRGSTVTAVFYKGEGTEGAELGRASATADKDWVTLKWKAKGPSDTEGSALVTWEVTLPESSRESQKDRGTMRVWMRAITVVARNADASDAFFEGARFAVEQQSTEKVFELVAGDDAGLEVELTDFRVPAVRWVAPYELVAWTKQGPKKWEARVRRPVFQAVFKQAPERDAEPEGGKFKRKQFVNVTPGSPAAPDEGHRVRLLVGSDIPGKEAWEVWMEVAIGDAKGKFSRRNDPLPTLVDADEPLGELKAGAPLDADLTDVVHQSDLRAVRFRKKGVFAAQPELPRGEFAAAFEVELGAAGGDVCTVKIGSTPACSDATLEITNWRRLGYHLFAPGPALSTQGGLEAGSCHIPGAVKSKIDEELAKAFIEYKEASAQFYAAGAWPEYLPGGVQDGKTVGKSAGKKVLIVEETPLRTLAERLTPSTKKPWEHVIVLADYITEVKSGQADGTVATTLTSAEKTVTLCDKKFGVFVREREHKRSSIHYLELQVTKVSGKTLTSEKRAELRKNAGALARWFDDAPVRVWSRRGTGDTDALRLAEQYVTHTSRTKIKLKLPAAAPGDPGKLFSAYSGVTVSATIYFEKRDPESCLGMAYRDSGGIMVLPTLAGDVSLGKLHTTVVHELAHVIGQAYGGKADLPVSGRDKDIPGVLFRMSIDAGGYVYDGHGHQGGHCAFGLSTKDRKEPNFEAGFSLTGARMNFSPKCINWGNEVYLRRTGLTLCAGCAAAMRAQGLADLADLR